MCNKLLDKDHLSEMQGGLNYCPSEQEIQRCKKKGTDPRCSETQLMKRHQGELFHPIIRRVKDC